jgi:sugar (pentulose or hexulose) kinase
MTARRTRRPDSGHRARAARAALLEAMTTDRPRPPMEAIYRAHLRLSPEALRDRLEQLEQRRTRRGPRLRLIGGGL